MLLVADVVKKKIRKVIRKIYNERRTMTFLKNDKIRKGF